MRCIPLADRDDVALGGDARMHAVADRGVLGGQAERVVAHRPQHAVAAPAAQARDDVADRVVEDVPHVQLARGVRQHLDDVGLRALDLAGLGIRRVERARVVPDALPALLDLPRLVLLCHRAILRVQKSLSRERPRGSSRGAAAFASCSTEEAPLVSLQHNLASGIASRLHFRRRAGARSAHRADLRRRACGLDRGRPRRALGRGRSRDVLHRRRLCGRPGVDTAEGERRGTRARRPRLEPLQRHAHAGAREAVA